MVATKSNAPNTHEQIHGSGRPVQRSTQAGHANRFSHVLGLQHAAGNQATRQLLHSNVPPIVNHVLASGRGQALDPAIRAFVEMRFRHNFSGVRIHTDSQAASSANAVNAKAYTVGQDIVFGMGQFAPHTPAGRQVLAHELTHVVQENRLSNPLKKLELAPTSSRLEKEAEQAGKSIEDPHGQPFVTLSRNAHSPDTGVVHRQAITPLAAGGGYSGLMERDRRETDTTAVDPGIRIVQAIQLGWRQIAALEADVLRYASNDQRLAMLEQLINAYWTGGAEEEAIIRIIESVPLQDAPAFVKRLTDEKIKGKPILEELDRVVDLGNNLELHAKLSELRIKAMGPQKGVKSLETAPILPWHDVMGLFESAAIFSFSRTTNGKIRIKYPAAVFGAKDFGDEISNLPTDFFTSGHIYEPDQVLVIHDYDNGRFVPVVARELLGHQHAGVRAFLGHVATVASFAAPGGAAKTLLGKAALFTLERVLPTIFLLIDENRLKLVKWFPTWGPRMIRYAEYAQLGISAYGLFNFVRAGWKIFKDWRAIRQARTALEGASISPEAENLALNLEKQADQIFSEADKLQQSESALGTSTPGAAPTDAKAPEVIPETAASGAKPQPPAPTASDKVPPQAKGKVQQKTGSSATLEAAEEQMQRQVDVLEIFAEGQGKASSGSLQADVEAQHGVSNLAKPGGAPVPERFDVGNFAHTFAEELIPESKLPRGLDKEVKVELPDGGSKRLDRVDRANGMIYEIKPNTPSQVKAGEDQIKLYIEYMNREKPLGPGRSWRGQVVTYDRNTVRRLIRKYGWRE